MTLVPTNVTIQGRRVWLEGATEADVAYVNYHTSFGGVLLEKKDNLPRVERIEHDETVPQKG